jgi:Vitamin K-dependent gamma-carboxylase
MTVSATPTFVEPEGERAPEPRAGSRWARYVAFWSEREAPDSLALLRITFGLALVANVVQPMLNGSLIELFAAPSSGGIFPISIRATLSVFHLISPSAGVVWALAVVFALASLTLAAGLFTRAAAIACLLLDIAFADRLQYFFFGSDSVYRVFCYLMVLAPAGAAWSLDAALRGKGAADVPRWPRRLFIAQLTILYVRTGIVKLGSSWSFTDGYSALYYALNLPSYARWPGAWAASIYPLTQVATVISKYFEITFFVVPLSLYLGRRADRGGALRRLIAHPYVRFGYLATGIFMHLALLVVMKLGMFSIVMIALYPCLLEPEEAARILTAIARLRHRLPTNRTTPAFEPNPVIAARPNPDG